MDTVHVGAHSNAHFHINGLMTLANNDYVFGGHSIVYHKGNCISGMAGNVEFDISLGMGKDLIDTRLTVDSSVSLFQRYLEQQDVAEPDAHFTIRIYADTSLVFTKAYSNNEEASIDVDLLVLFNA
jgi:hypothetical protein